MKQITGKQIESLETLVKWLSSLLKKNDGMKKVLNVSAHNGIEVGQLIPKQMSGRKCRIMLCKGIYTDEFGTYYAGLQYIDKKATKQNKNITVSSKSAFWFEKI